MTFTFEKQQKCSNMTPNFEKWSYSSTDIAIKLKLGTSWEFGEKKKFGRFSTYFYQAKKNVSWESSFMLLIHHHHTEIFKDSKWDGIKGQVGINVTRHGIQSYL